MDRRAFIAGLAATLTGAVLDPERLLWVPGAKTYFLPFAGPRVMEWYAPACGQVLHIRLPQRVHVETCAPCQDFPVDLTYSLVSLTTLPS